MSDANDSTQASLLLIICGHSVVLRRETANTWRRAQPSWRGLFDGHSDDWSRIPTMEKVDLIEALQVGEVLTQALRVYVTHNAPSNRDDMVGLRMAIQEYCRWGCEFDLPIEVRDAINGGEQ